MYGIKKREYQNFLNPILMVHNISHSFNDRGLQLIIASKHYKIVNTQILARVMW